MQCRGLLLKCRLSNYNMQPSSPCDVTMYAHPPDVADHLVGYCYVDAFLEQEHVTTEVYTENIVC